MISSEYEVGDFSDITAERAMIQPKKITVTGATPCGNTLHSKFPQLISCSKFLEEVHQVTSKEFPC